MPPGIDRPRLAVVFLVMFGLVMFLPGIASVPPLDRDEPRYTQASKQMLETGDFVDIRFQEEARHKKPAGIYWLQVGVMKAVGGDTAAIWKYRLVSLAGALAALVLTWWVARAFMPSKEAFLCALLFGCTFLLGVEAHIAKTDAMLLACIVAAQGVLARAWLGLSRLPIGLTVAFWSAVGAGILIKGPIILMVSGLTLVALCLWERRVGWIANLRPLSGVFVMLLIAVPWYVAIGLRTDGAFFDEALGRDLLGKIATGQESHGAPPGVHLAVMLATFWPATTFLVIGLAGVRRALAAPVVRFALCWAIPTWLAFELTATKLPHYVLPVFPALAMLAVALTPKQDDLTPPKPLWLGWLGAIWLVLVPVTLMAGAVVVPLLLGDAILWAAFIVFAIAVLVSIKAARFLLEGAPRHSMLTMAACAALIAFASYGFGLPRLSAIWISNGIVDTARLHAGCDAPRIVSVGWREPSLVFLGGTDTALRLPESAIEELSRVECAVLAVESRQHQGVMTAAAAKQMELGKIGSVEGFALNGGDQIEVSLYRKTGPK